MRKESGLEVLDRINLYVAGNDMLIDVIKKYEESLKHDTLTDTIFFNEDADYTEYSINGEDLKIAVKKN